MDSESGRPDPGLDPEDEELDDAATLPALPRSRYDVTPYNKERLELDGPSFEFFQAVRLLERLNPERSAIGKYSQPRNEVVRFRANNTLEFPASDLHEVDFPENGIPRMTVNFMGLTGPAGVLPLYYTELVRDRIRSRDYAMRDFFDLFNHRIISLFYQAWEKYRFTVAYERGDRDKFSHHLLDLVGLGTKGLQDRTPSVDDEAFIFYSGLLSLQPRSGAALRGILMDYFDVPVEIEQFMGAWHPLTTDNQCWFEHGETLSEQIGTGAIVGDEVWDQQSAVRIALGPLTLRQYLDFLPEGSGYRPLRALVRFFAGGAMDFELKLILKKEQAPPCVLGAEGEEEPRLGWVSWAKTRMQDADPADAVLRI